ncbi:VanZ family protein [Algoriphagus namhaensis]
MILGISWLVILLFAMLTPGDEFPEIDVFSLQDKVIHFVCFGLLSFIWCGVKYKSSQAENRKTLAWNYLIFGVLMGIFVEIGQRYVPYRTFDLQDIIANEAGGLVGFLTYLNIRKRK